MKTFVFIIETIMMVVSRLLPFLKKESESKDQDSSNTAE